MIIYKATNRINGKIYIGQTIGSLNKRKSNHIFKSNNGCSIYFHNALFKYGVDNFKWEIIRICDSIESLNAFEQYYILYYNSMENGYNQQSGGKNCRASDKTKQKMSKARIGKPLSEKTKKRMSKNNVKYWLGKNLFIETRKKMSQAHSGENNHFYGKIHTQETKIKMRQAKLGAKLSEEHKKKISIANGGENHWNYGKETPDNVKEKIKQAKIGKKFSKGTKQKMSDSAKNRKPFTEEHKRNLSISKKLFYKKLTENNNEINKS